MDVLVLIHPAEEGGFWAEFPTLDGCFAQGEAVEEVLADAHAAVQSHVEALHEGGQPLPDPYEIIVATIHAPFAA